MRERQLIDAIHRRLPKSLHRQSMTLGSLTSNGTPDYYYDGPRSDLWVEYKQLKSMPRNKIVDCGRLLTPLQQQWIVRRHDNGKNAVVIVGLPNKTGLLLAEPWWAPIGESRSYNWLANWIIGFCTQGDSA